nr:DNA-deoxyinosine glycosylase [Mitsuokella multacida]
MHCESLPPSIGNGARILILGSMPGIASLRAGAYYAHPKNRFWPLMAVLLKEPLHDGYEARLAMLCKHKIALWDAITSCDREGSLDSAIQNEEGADIGALLETYPSIKTICCKAQNPTPPSRNTTKVSSREKISPSTPSTSPAKARWSMEALIGVWKDAILHECGA